MTRLKEEPIWYDPDAMSVNSSPTSPETERKKKESTSMGSDRGDKEYFIFHVLYVSLTPIKKADSIAVYRTIF